MSKLVITLLSIFFISFFATSVNIGWSQTGPTKTFIAELDFCEVEFRAGNTNNPELHKVVARMSMSKGDQYSYNTIFLNARREANPGHCNSGLGVWQTCSWGECRLH